MRRAIAIGVAAICVAVGVACGSGSSSSDVPQTFPTGDAATKDVATATVDGSSSNADATSDASTVGDAGTDSNACDPAKPFGVVTALAPLNGLTDDAVGRLTGDELSIYFASQREGGVGATDVFVAKRATLMAPFGNPAVVPGVSTTGNDYDPAISEDGLSLVVSQYNGAGNAFDLFLYQRASTSDAFDGGQTIPAIDSPNDDTEPSFARHDQTLCFARSSSLIYCSDKSAGTFGTPTAQGALTMGGSGLPYPTESADGLSMYFGSKRATGAGGVDIWVATRATLADTFGSPTNVMELNSPLDDTPTWLSADSCRLYFQSNRTGGKGGLDLYVAERSK